MKLEIAKAIADAGASDGLELYEDYGGRGMGSKTTAGITYSNLGSLLSAVAEVAIASPDMGERMTSELRKVRTDSMGRDGIVY